MFKRQNSQIFSALFLCAVLVPSHGAIKDNSTASGNPSSGSPFDIKSMLSQLLPSSGGDVRQQASQALGFLKYAFVGYPPKYRPNGKCLEHVTEFLRGVLNGEMWALKMIDAMGKPETSVLSGNFKWLGSYDECVDIRASINESGEITHPWKGQYCTTVFKLKPLGKQFGIDYSKSSLGQPSLSLGVCLPNSCSDMDVTLLLYKLLQTLQVDAKSYAPYGYCQKESLDFDTKAIVAIVICSVFGVLIVLATLYDVIIQNWPVKHGTILPNNSNGAANVYVVSNGVDGLKANCQTLVNGTKKPINDIPDEEMSKMEMVANEKMSKMEMVEPSQKQTVHTISKALLAFSVYTNGRKILNTNQPKGTLTAVNGIRFISMSWVILGHVFAFQLTGSSNIGDYFQVALKQFDFQAILNATLSVDTFFTLSGLLVSYLSLKEMKKSHGAKKFKWGMFYFHRFWRLTPPYMLFMMVYVCLMKYFYNGPQWSEGGIGAVSTQNCVDYWWRNLLYINNLFPSRDSCMGWSWYLANDMQFYLLSPLMLLPLYYSAVLGTLSCLALLAVYSVSSGVISHRDHLSANMIFDAGRPESFDNLYDKPWTRIGPYAVGFFAGYILYRTNCKIRMPKIVSLLGWLVATGIAMSVLYGLYNDSGTPPHLSSTLTAVYNATSRAAWAVAVCWVIIACATGHGGFVNTILSWKAMIPLSRLTYCAYLVHPVVMYFYIMAGRKILYFTNIQAAYLFLGHMCMTYAVSFLVSLAFESPMMGLEKALLGREKNS